MLDDAHLPLGADGAGTQRDAGEDLTAILIVGARALVGRYRGGHVEELSAEGEFLAADTVPKEPVIANPVEAYRQHVHEKSVE